MASDDENIVNLASFRKKQRQSDKQSEKRTHEVQAAANRVKFGRKGADKKIARLDEQRRKNEFDGKRLDKPPLKDRPASGSTPSDTKLEPQDKDKD